MAIEPRSEILEIPLAVHGGLDHSELRRLGIDPAAVLDFSVNINPYGPPAAVSQALALTAVNRYPDRDSLELREALASNLGVAAGRILVGNGAMELIWLAALAFLRPEDRVLILGPTFAEYGRAAALQGALPTVLKAQEKGGFRQDPAVVRERLEQMQPQVVFLCNPNNPTGTTLAPKVVAGWARGHPQTLFVVDEVYLPFAPELGSFLEEGAANVLVLRSMTKDFALAGLRLGYAVGPERLIAALDRVRPPWSVNALAQAAGVAAIRDRAHLEASLKMLATAKKDLITGLKQIGLEPLPSAVHFFVLRVGDGAAVRRQLLQRGILVRDATSFGMPAFVRIAARRPEENDRLLAAMREVIP